jgi:hypothetical protein
MYKQNCARPCGLDRGGAGTGTAKAYLYGITYVSVRDSTVGVLLDPLCILCTLDLLPLQYRVASR